MAAISATFQVLLERVLNTLSTYTCHEYGSLLEGDDQGVYQALAKLEDALIRLRRMVRDDELKIFKNKETIDWYGSVRCAVNEADIILEDPLHSDSNDHHQERIEENHDLHLQYDKGNREYWHFFQSSLLGCGAAGGLLRNNEGAVVMAFAQPLWSTPSASHAELQALCLGLKACVNAGFSSLMIESDCLEVINKICIKEIDPGPGDMFYEEFKLIFSNVWSNLNFRFIPRSCNKAAHLMASLGSKLSSGSIWWYSAPNEIRNQVLSDSL